MQSLVLPLMLVGLCFLSLGVASAAQEKAGPKTKEAFRELTLENESLKAVFLPELGGKMAKLIRKASGRDFLYHNPYQKGYRRPEYGDPFDRYDVSGFDECFPTIGICPYPEAPWKGVSLPDHGELWSIPWKFRQEKRGLRLWADGRALPYRFSKLVRLEGESVVIDYTVTNKSPHPMKVLWASHPLLSFPPGSRIYLPDGARIRVGESRGDRLGKFGDALDWPHAVTKAMEPVDMSLLTPPSPGYVDKLYTTRLPEGWCGIRDPKTGEGVLFTFPVEKVPYVGLWLGLGGWPEGKPYYQAALEPCSGTPDNLDQAVEDWKSYAVVPAKGKLTWTMKMQVSVFESGDALKKAAR